MMYFSRNAVFGKVSLRSEVCKHIGNSLHGAATLFLFTVQKTFFLNPAFIIQELSLRLFFFVFESRISIRKNTGTHYAIKEIKSTYSSHPSELPFV